ncbi:Asp-tRNA(Asn)/Glu-tRNA(Gln) amidotransferase GatCAB subunit C [Deltaproteobacteria bacterium Smac51]|nr:Asp-tRNA(Asn)/Glu-tRNA(Gln) amidotransferase GatCAB subunit C [Deltaproteobacteria bacterium Smac51]
MPIDLKIVQSTASLARLNLAQGLEPEQAQADLEKLTHELATIVGYIDILGEADTQGVEPLYSPMLEAPGAREDVVINSNTTEEILEQAPDRIGSFFAVPKIL